MDATTENMGWVLLIGMILGVFALIYSSEKNVEKIRVENRIHQESVCKKFGAEGVVTGITKLVALNNFNSTQTKGSINGSGSGFGVFLGIGFGSGSSNINGSISSSQEIYINYAVEDKKGINFYTEKLSNNPNIRVKETDRSDGVIKTICMYGMSGDTCAVINTMKIFEVPFGTVIKDIKINI